MRLKLVFGLWSSVFCTLLYILYSIFLIPQAHAAGEFATSYFVHYDVDSSGVTEVTEEVHLKNLTERFYASNFSLNISATQISDVVAVGNLGNLPVKVSQDGPKTKIDVTFNQQVVGKDKSTMFTLKFKSKDFAQHEGRVWQVMVPKISSKTDLDAYNLTLSVPIDFGDPSAIIPEPKNQSESGDKVNLSFSKEQLLDQGILATFGSTQVFDFNLVYKLENSSIVPKVAHIPLPPDTAYQQVIIDSLSPQPDNVGIDSDGNYIALYRVDRRQTKSVSAHGMVKLYINSRLHGQPLNPLALNNYTKPDKYWDSDSPTIKSKLEEIFKNGTPNTNKEKARLINQFVVANLKYGQDKLNNSIERLGALTALSNPNEALCQEFTDLFIALARAAGIPARSLIGYAYTSNRDLRPLSFEKDLLHAWPEYYDSEVGWVMIDPTWQNTTGGVDYFSKLDLNHFVLAIRGLSSESPVPADDIKVSFSDGEFVPRPSLSASLETPTQLFAGFPNQIGVTLRSQGNALLDGQPIVLTTSKLTLSAPSSFYSVPIPPYGHLTYNYAIKSDSFTSYYTDNVTLDVHGQVTSRQIQIKPFLAFAAFPVAVFLLLGGMVGLYFIILGLHLHTYRRGSLHQTVKMSKSKSFAKMKNKKFKKK